MLHYPNGCGQKDMFFWCASGHFLTGKFDQIVDALIDYRLDIYFALNLRQSEYALLFGILSCRFPEIREATDSAEHIATVTSVCYFCPSAEDRTP